MLCVMATLAACPAPGRLLAAIAAEAGDAKKEVVKGIFDLNQVSDMHLHVLRGRADLGWCSVIAGDLTHCDDFLLAQHVTTQAGYCLL